MELTQEIYDNLPIVDYDENYDEVDEITEQIVKEVNEYIDKVINRIKTVGNFTMERE